MDGPWRRPRRHAQLPASDEDDEGAEAALDRARAAERDGDERAEDDVSDGEDDDEESEGGQCSSEEERDQAAAPYSEGHLAPMRRVIELVELSLRNVTLSPAYIALAAPEFMRVQGAALVLSEQASSARWPAPFVALLKRARMVRVRPISKEGKAQLRTIAGCCQACGSPEHRCNAVFELVGAPPGAPVRGSPWMVPVTGIAAELQAIEDADDAIAAGAEAEDAAALPPEYLGMFACGRGCLEKALAALHAQNFVTDVAYGVRRELAQALAEDPSLAERWVADEADGATGVRALTDGPGAARVLLDRLAALQAVARGAPLCHSLLAPTGCAAVWRRVDAALGARCSTEATVLRRAGARAHASLGGDCGDEGEDEEEDSEAAPRSRSRSPSPASALDAAPPSARTRSKTRMRAAAPR